MPKVSVIIPTYNRGAFITQTINSVLDQTYNDYEILVVDDGSTDDTRQHVNQFGSRVRYIYQENKGPSAARNTGILNANGKYIAFCDSDDRFLPDKLQKQIDFINKRPACKFTYSWYYNTDKAGKITKLRKPTACKTKEQLQYCLITRNFTIRTSTVMIHKKCFQRAGLFNEKYLYSQDWDMWLRLAAYFKGYCLQEPLSEYRLHDNNRSSKSVKIYHPEIMKSALRLYGWNKQIFKRLDDAYGKKRDRRQG